MEFIFSWLGENSQALVLDQRLNEAGPMSAIVLTVVVCAVSMVADSTTCEIYTETRPLADLRSCMHSSERARLGVLALERAGRAVTPDDELTIRCRMSTGGSGITAS
jgi:hypothetical protein